MINLTIDGQYISVQEGTTILEAARMADKQFRRPNLCRTQGRSSRRCGSAEFRLL